MEKSLVSVIIATKNEGNNIENCLKSIVFQTYKNIEIIVVDNNSTDDTKEIARKYTDIVLNREPKRSIQSNYAVDISSGKYIFHADADMVLAPKLINSCIQNALKYQDVIGFYVSEIVLGKSYWSKVRRFERGFYDGTAIDAVRFFHKDAFVKINGYDEEMLWGPDDWDLNRRLSEVGKLKIISDSESLAKTDNAYNNIENLTKWHNAFDRFLEERGVTNAALSEGSILFHNESEFNLKKYMTKKRVYSKSFSQYISKWGINDPIIKKQFGILYRYFSVFIENGKWKKLIKHPLLTSGMYFLRINVGLLYLKTKWPLN
ncbi:MAG: glycosyltransferase family 2 protein [Candidatus Acidulodesulfobacterium ferriphilum]|uniref:Glycosyltransferase family 2 protein n=1 Tax=Candidatus Acidulodesulfobacterium ferriphilum TaxID=2597223 RepID=A0A519BAM9_9DELT|nr:MAG: glycosyltransferase family 2 protein [Candidatus Acidulodesulfobacterium ferriphilum]